VPPQPTSARALACADTFRKRRRDTRTHLVLTVFSLIWAPSAKAPR
jgi:hypothetical protein